MKSSFNKILSIVLIVAMTTTNVGFVTLADSISDVINSYVETSREDESSQKHYDEQKDLEENNNPINVSVDITTDSDTDYEEINNEIENEEDTEDENITEDESTVENEDDQGSKNNIENVEETEREDGISTEQVATHSNAEQNDDTDGEINIDDVGSTIASISDTEEIDSINLEKEKTSDINFDIDLATISSISVENTDNILFGAPTITGIKRGEWTINTADGANKFDVSNVTDPITGEGVAQLYLGSCDYTGNWYDALGFSMSKNQITEINFSHAPSTINVDEYVELKVDTSDTRPSNFISIGENSSGYITRAGTIINIYYSSLIWQGSKPSGGNTVYYLRLAFAPLYNKSNIDSFFEGFENLRIINSASSSASPLTARQVVSCKNLFKNCKNLTQIPDLAGNYTDATSFESMFEGCESLTSIPLNPFSTTSMSDVRSCKNMFKGCKSLTAPITLYHFDAVRDLESMFEDCENIPSINITLRADRIGTNYRSTKRMFKNCKKLSSIAFNGPWARVNECEEMFYKCASISTVDLKDINLGSVNSANRMFAGCESLTTISLDNDVTQMIASGTNMFEGCKKLKGGAGYNIYNEDMIDNELGRIDHGGLYPGYFTCNNASSITNVNISFNNDWFTRFNTSIKKASISAIRIINNNNMGSMKEQVRIAAFRDGNTSSKCYGYLNDANEFILHIYKLNVELSSDFSGAFKDFTNVREITGLGEFAPGSLMNVSSLFENDRELISFTWPVGGYWNSGVSNTSRMFCNCSNLQAVNGARDINTLNVTDFSYMFENCSELTTLDLNNIMGNWNFGFTSARNMSYMFAGCTRLSTLGNFRFGVGNTRTPYVTNLSHMFSGCENLGEFNLSGFDATYVTDMSSMYENCKRLTQSPSFGDRSVRLVNASCMFKGCSNMTDVHLYDLSGSNIRIASEMFSGCTSLATMHDFDRNFSYNSMTTTKEMFKDCSSLTTLDFAGNTLSSLNDGTSMFEGCSALTSILVDNNVRGARSVAITTDMFKGCTSLEGSNGTKYNANNTDGKYFAVDYGGITPGYLTCSNAGIYDSVRFSLPSDWDVGPYGKSNITKIRIFKGNDIGHYDSVATISETNRLYSYIDGDTLKINYGNSFTNMKLSAVKGFFKNFTGVTEIEGFNEFDIANITDLSSLFENMTNITEIDFNTNTMQANQNFSKMFKGCNNLLYLDLTKWTTTSATDMSEMFADCNKLSYIIVSTDASGNCNFNTNLVTQSSNMFNNCLRLEGEAETKYETFGNRDKSFAVIDEGPTSPHPGYLSPIYNYVEEGWYDGMAMPANQITKISFLKYPTPIPTHVETKELVAGKLRLYRNGTEVVIYSVDGSEIGAPSDSSYIFSSKNTANQFSSLATISNLNLFRTKRAINISHMFEGTKLSSIDFTGINLSRIANTAYLFKDAKDLTNLTFGPDFDTSDIRDMSHMFDGCEGLTNIDISRFNTANVRNMNHMFNACTNLNTITLPNTFTTSSVRDMGHMFANCTNLRSLNVNQLDTTNVATMSYMFSNCTNISNININNFNTNNVKSMDNMFGGCINLQSISWGNNFNTSNVLNMSAMFKDCEKLTSISFGSGFDTTNVSDMSKMFAGCKNITNLDMTQFNTSNVVNMSDMFSNCNKLVGNRTISSLFGANSDTILDFNNFDTTNVTDMSNMFKDCSSITGIDISSFDTRNVTNTNEMFASCSELKMIIVASESFVNTGIVTSTNMFRNCDNLMGGEGTKWIDTMVLDKTYAIIDEGPTSTKPGYLTNIDVEITYEANGGTGTMAKSTARRFNNFGIPQSGFTKDGYNQKEWVDQYGGRYSVNNGVISNVNRKLVLTAEWEQIINPTPHNRQSATGGGGSAGARKGTGIIQNQERALNFVLRTMVSENEYTWVYDSLGIRKAISIDANSIVGKAMINSNRTKGAYQLSQDGKTMLLGGGGLYRIQNKGMEEWIAFDNYCNIMTGFVTTSTETKMLDVSYNSVQSLVSTNTLDEDNIFLESKGNVGRYYLYEKNDFKGRLWNQPIRVNGINYQFDIAGKVISSNDLPLNQGVWEYNPIENKWKYFIPDIDGRARYFKDTISDINYNGQVNKYIFDENGNLMKGYFTWQGQNYYGQETGQFIGAVTLIK